MLQEHEALAIAEDNLQLFRSAFVMGTGCPQLSLSFILQLQRKGSAMDIFSFLLDLLALQPPPPLTEPHDGHRQQQRQQQVSPSSSKTDSGDDSTHPEMNDAGISIYYPAGKDTQTLNPISLLDAVSRRNSRLVEALHLKGLGFRV